MACIDCDSHILLDDAFHDVDPEFASRKPRIVSDTEGDLFVVYPERQGNIPDYCRHIPSPFFPRPRQQGDDPEVRIADMTKSRIDMQVLVPSNGSFYYDVEPRFASNVYRSYNNSIGRILKKYPGKFIGLKAHRGSARHPRRALRKRKLGGRDGLSSCGHDG